MCLAIPAKIESIDAHKATVELAGTRAEVIAALVPEAKVGDWVLVHAGCAITVVDEADALETFAILREMADLEGR